MQAIQVQRGVRLFNALLFNDEQMPTAAKPATEQMGRDPELIRQRNQLLFYRYYYKAAIQRKLYIDVCRELSTELFISQSRIKEVLQDNLVDILAIKRSKPTAKDLQKMFPFMVW